ncbi:unnamed protein product [Parascedosporium putredinis]|uniref:Uncharacterized protein n=1 Tax=Parascedosporium putredinis TaxID=1442378 RepID=A0A9P1H7Y0_9PEZI|nr:unnamed protein product [Parascedosporium putredinis]CAI8001876.1 unnamed protein product [Parascedosporium putredinis]
MSSFGGRRKARVIKVDDAEEPGVATQSTTQDTESSRDDEPGKPASAATANLGAATTTTTKTKFGDDDDDDDSTGNVVVRGSLSRANSTKQKKRKSASRLSFGVRADDDDDDGDQAETSGLRTPELLTPKRGGDVGLKKAIALKDLAMRSRGRRSGRDTPRNSGTEDEDIHMDLSELEGAVVVDSAELEAYSGTGGNDTASSRILTDAEIRERRNAKDEDSTRLVHEDENLYEGFDEFVDDGGVALGRKAEREARRQKRAEMASMIQEAEGNSDEESDDSDAERRVAFEASQSRAGMDGLRRPTQNPAEAAKPKITPLSTMSECLAALQASFRLAERDLAAKSKETLLNEAGEKYRAVAGAPRVQIDGPTDSPARQILPAESATEFAAERGLESFGTPVAKNGATDEVEGTP